MNEARQTPEDEENFAAIDEALLPMHQLVAQCTAPLRTLAPFQDPDSGMQLYADQMTLSMPVEMDMVVGDDGSVVLGAVPPLYRYGTSYEPVFHQLKMTITRSNGTEAT